MNTFELFLKIGWKHIITPDAVDHMLFLMALTVHFRLKELKKLVFLITLFTITHTTSLILSTYGFIHVPGRYIETAIVFTIIITALSNIIQKDKKKIEITHWIFALLFGFIHGLGFTRAFEMAVSGIGEKWLPLLGFALGVEAGQLVVILVFLSLITLVEKLFKVSAKTLTTAVSFFILGYAVSLLHSLSG